MRIRLGVWLIAALLGGCDQPVPADKGFAGLGNQAAAFTPVVPGRVFSFPADHGPHDGFRIEWWYVTANLRTSKAVSSACNGRCFAVP
jgi:predicted secreted hydrolase